jgi:uncharacterized membrane protein YjjB (DUF3815 family)
MMWLAVWYVYMITVCMLFHVSVPKWIWIWPIFGYSVGYGLHMVASFLVNMSGGKNVKTNSIRKE